MPYRATPKSSSTVWYIQRCEVNDSWLCSAGDFKPALAAAINAILQPVRDHFASDPKAKELLKKVKVRCLSQGTKPIKFLAQLIFWRKRA